MGSSLSCRSLSRYIICNVNVRDNRPVLKNMIFHLYGEMFHLHGGIFHLHDEMFHLHGGIFHLHGEMFHLHGEMFHLQGEMVHLHCELKHRHGQKHIETILEFLNWWITQITS